MKVELKIDGMKCEGCVNRIKNVLSKTKGIISYEVSLEHKNVIMEIKKEKIKEEVIEKIEALGFNVSK